MYTTLALEKAMKAHGLKADFRATGQTGILIAGSGVSIDAVVDDFISAAVEYLAPANEADHGDPIEHLDTLFHASSTGVWPGLLPLPQAATPVRGPAPKRPPTAGLPEF